MKAFFSAASLSKLIHKHSRSITSGLKPTSLNSSNIVLTVETFSCQFIYHGSLELILVSFCTTNKQQEDVLLTEQQSVRPSQQTPLLLLSHVFSAYSLLKPTCVCAPSVFLSSANWKFMLPPSCLSQCSLQQLYLQGIKILLTYVTGNQMIEVKISSKTWKRV